MNSLSWFLYLADIIGNIAVLALLIGIVLTIFLIIVWVGRGAIAADLGSNEYPTDKYPDGTSSYRRWAAFKKMTQNKWLYFTIILMFSFVALTPSKQTFYLIAASEATEIVVKTPEVQDIFTDLQQVIKSNLKGMIKTDPVKE